MVDIQRELRLELRHGERLLWSGMPRQGVAFRHSDLLVVAFLVVWMAIPIAGVVTDLSSGKPAGVVFIAVPFLAIGGYVLIRRFIGVARDRARTVYAVTNQRVLRVVAKHKRQLTSLSLKTLTDIVVTEDRNGEGSIQFGTVRWPWSLSFGAGWPGMDQHAPPRFERIANVRQVYEAIMKAQAEAGQERY